MKSFITALVLLFSSTLFAVDLELTQGISSALPIGIDSFGGDETGRQISAVINNDLSFSGQFRIIAPPQSFNANPSVGSWRQAGADSILSGSVRRTGYNRYEVHYELLDAVAQGKVLLSRSYQISGNELRPLAHHISDDVYQKLTGERGVFSTKIAYILVQRQGERARYFLEVADVDGYNPQSLLVSTEPIMSPSWSPDGRQIAYVSFEKKKAQIFTVDVATGRRRLVTDFTGINGAPDWSTDGRSLAVVLSKGGSPKIYTVDLSNGSMKQLTFGDAIDTEPSFSPDGRSMLFTSGRGGSPQVYRLSLADGSISRLTYEGNYNAKASYTPDQKHIVMLHREDKSFNIAVQDEAGHVSQLTFAPLDESPSVAPNGRLILYATRVNDQGVLGLVSIDGRVKIRLPARQGDVQEPAWSPYLG
ncbi:Tol-Pal system beta propeller repeat protein TolB [Legionella jordanis]|uniref:Tol-Pal system beta propeller repeat protein TolB n=1 Tax=Legionella jordanis TaxID=456 RepID=UPI0007309411|nr:Tol-Pal system beta propeller repeat protein TolB [Legionella jordanis]RMX03404.1 Tol-Pal system beta propeller repeat protein TolB [Legionella jordanis]RMX18313.1 Tol-Pal system beta propeller repeat protein TolB [Legionella jordanis]HAT8713283.1 Tol-Pal system beta propeller repeat protein TolB [Legionella jordanis]